MTSIVSSMGDFKMIQHPMVQYILNGDGIMEMFPN
jgi:hypothetical protein